jgi:hypothetical protein
MANAKHTWRVEWHECGWSSRWIVVSGYHGNGTFKLLDEGHQSVFEAGAAAAKWNS